MSRKMYRLLATNLGDAVFSARVAGEDEAILNNLIDDISRTLFRCNAKFNKGIFTDAVEARVNENMAQLAIRDREAQTKNY